MEAHEVDATHAHLADARIPLSNRRRDRRYGEAVVIEDHIKLLNTIESFGDASFEIGVSVAKDNVTDLMYWRGVRANLGEQVKEQLEKLLSDKGVEK